MPKKSTEKFDIFISYRREGGIETARLFYERLIHLGYRVSFDMETLRSGKFNAQLCSRIEECKDVIVLLSKDALVLRENPQDDWFRLEIAHAIRNGKNIIPIFLRDFTPPERGTLPEDIDDLLDYEGVAASAVHFDSTLTRLRELLVSKPVNALRRRTMKIIAGVVGVLAVSAVLLYSHVVAQSRAEADSEASLASLERAPYPATAEDEAFLNEFLANLEAIGDVFNHIAGTCLTYLQRVDDAIQAGDYEALEDAKELALTLPKDTRIVQCMPPATLMQTAANQPVNMETYINFYNEAKVACTFSPMALSLAHSRFEKHSFLKQEQKLAFTASYRTNVEITAKRFAYRMLLELKNIPLEALEDFRARVTERWEHIPELKKEWILDEKVLTHQLTLVHHQAMQAGMQGSALEQEYQLLINAQYKAFQDQLSPSKGNYKE